MKKIFLLVFATLFILTANARIYYIDPAGSDGSGNGTMLYPYFTLTKAFSYVAPGDTIYARGGNYRVLARPEMMYKSGTANNRISVLNYPGEYPVIMPDDTNQYYRTGATIGVIMRGCNYITFRGFEITGFEMPPYLPGNLVHGFMVDDCRFCNFENLSIHGNGNGLRCEGISGQNRFINIDSYDNNDPFTGSDPYGNADGIQIAFMEGISQNDTSWVIACRTWLNSDDGLDFYGNHGTVIVDSCWSFRNGYKTWTEVVTGNGNGIKLGPCNYTSTAIKRLVTRSIVAGNKTKGIETNQSFGRTVVKNMTAAFNGGIGFHFSDDAGYDLKFEFYNNVAFSNGTNAYLCPEAQVTTCTFLVGAPAPINSSYSVTASDFNNVDLTFLTNARINNKLPEIGTFYLTDRSDLRDTGTNVGLWFYASKPDLGAFEYKPLKIPLRLVVRLGRVLGFKGYNVKR